MSSAWEARLEDEATKYSSDKVPSFLPNTHQREALRDIISEAYVHSGKWSREQTIADVESILKRIAEYGPEQGTKVDGVACAFCDMGDCGYASKGKGFHDDECAVKDAQLILREHFKKEITMNPDELRTSEANDSMELRAENALLRELLEVAVNCLKRVDSALLWGDPKKDVIKTLEEIDRAEKALRGE